MKNYYEKEILVSSAYTDRRCKMSIYPASVLIQDAMTELFHQYECDAIRMSKTHGAVWAVARSKVNYLAYPFWMDRVRVRAFPVKLSPVVVHINTVIETLDGSPLLLCSQELCAIDVKDHRLRRLDTTAFPVDMELLPPVFTTLHKRMKLDLDESHLVYRHLIRSSDTDMNGHMNNAAYVRLIVDAFPSSFWDAWRLETFDIQYANEGREGEELLILRELAEDTCSVQIRTGERTLVKAFLQFDPNEAQ